VPGAGPGVGPAAGPAAEPAVEPKFAAVPSGPGQGEEVAGNTAVSANAPTTKTSTRPPLYLLSAVAIGPSEPGGWPLSSSILAARLW